MLKKSSSAQPGAAELTDAQEEIRPAERYAVPMCEVHGQELRHVERTRPRKGTPEPSDAGFSGDERFLAPDRTIFPHARPTNPWLTHYDYCPVCDQARLIWKQAFVEEVKREAKAVERMKKKRHWQDED